MNCEATFTITVKLTAADLCEQEHLMHIRFNAPTVEQANGQKKVGAWNQPAFKDLTEQPTYERGSGNFYSLLMGRWYKPGRFVILLDFDNKVEGDSQGGMDLVEQLDMDQYNAPKQTTRSGGLTLPSLCQRRTSKTAPQQQNGNHPRGRQVQRGC